MFHNVCKLFGSKSHTLGPKMLNQIPQGGDGMGDQMTHICPTSPPLWLWGLTLIGALLVRCIYLLSCMPVSTKIKIQLPKE